MPSNCSVKFCKKRSIGIKDEGVSFYNFPHDENLREMWVKACGKDSSEINLKNARICSTHFRLNCFKSNPCIGMYLNAKCSRRLLRDDAVPTENLIWRNPDSLPKKVKTRKTRKKQENNIPVTASNESIFPNICSIETLTNPESDLPISSELDEIDLHGLKVRVMHPDDDIDIILQEPNTYIIEDGILKQNTQFDLGNNFQNQSSDIQCIIHDDTTTMHQNVQNIGGMKKSSNITRSKRGSLKLNNNPNMTELKKQLKIMTEKYKKEKEKAQKSRSDTVNQVKKILSRVFSSTQIEWLLNPGKTNARWTDEEIDNAVILHKMSPRVYHHLKYEMKLPLPSVLTMKRRICKLKKPVATKNVEKDCNESQTLQEELLEDMEFQTVEEEIQLENELVPASAEEEIPLDSRFGTVEQEIELDSEFETVEQEVDLDSEFETVERETQMEDEFEPVEQEIPLEYESDDIESDILYN